MGLVIHLVEYHGKNDEDGFLITQEVDKRYAWNNGKYIVQYDFGDHVELEQVHSGIPGDTEILHRPSNFETAFKWCNTLKGSDKKYVQRILMTLRSKSSLYIKFSS